MTEPNITAEATLFIWINALIDKVDELEKRVVALEAHKIELEPTSPGKAKLSDRLK